MSKENKATQDEYNKRLQEIIEMILEGEPTGTTVIYISEKYKISERQSYNIIKDARIKMASSIETNSVTHFIRAIAARKRLLKQANDGKDYELVLKIEQDLAKITGIYRYGELVQYDLELSKKLHNFYINLFIDLNECDDKDERIFRLLEKARDANESIFRSVIPRDFIEIGQPVEFETKKQEGIPCLL